MKLVYIYHSGFSIECNDFSILIDYYKDTEDTYVKNHRFPGKFYILSSHSHQDHFNPEILLWKRKRPDIQYLLSYDIKEKCPFIPEDTVFLEKGEIYKDNLLEVKAYGSTDIGISFLIKADGKTIFHAGDLNNWHWNEESTLKEIEAAQKSYLSELQKIASENPSIDVVLFPIDSRLGKDYMLGAEQFLSKIKVGLFAPMHFWGQYADANKFGSFCEKKGVKFFSITSEGQSIEI